MARIFFFSQVVIPRQFDHFSEVFLFDPQNKLEITSISHLIGYSL